MGVLLAFALFLIFALVGRFFGPMQGLVVGALVSAVLGGPTWSVIGVRLCVDAGLLAIVLVSMAVGRPFTLQYARERVAPEFWDRPDFIRANYVISAVWALAFAVMVAAELALLTVPNLSPRLGIAAIVLALIGAIKF